MKKLIALAVLVVFLAGCRSGCHKECNEQRAVVAAPTHERLAAEQTYGYERTHTVTEERTEKPGGGFQYRKQESVKGSGNEYQGEDNDFNVQSPQPRRHRVGEPNYGGSAPRYYGGTYAPTQGGARYFGSATPPR